MQSAFAQAMRGGIKGVAMVLDREVQPLTRTLASFRAKSFAAFRNTPLNRYISDMATTALLC